MGITNKKVRHKAVERITDVSKVKDRDLYDSLIYYQDGTKQRRLFRTEKHASHFVATARQKLLECSEIDFNHPDFDPPLSYLTEVRKAKELLKEGKWSDGLQMLAGAAMLAVEDGEIDLQAAVKLSSLLATSAAKHFNMSEDRKRLDKLQQQLDEILTIKAVA